MSAQSTGTSHLKTNLPCQDKLSCEVLSDGSLVAAIADGAGSAAKAEQGAEIAVGAVIGHLKRGLIEKRTDFHALLKEAAILARKEILATANRERITMRDYASTLLAVVLTAYGGGALQIGDGVIVASNSDEKWNWVFWPQRGEYANTTNFLTDEGAIDRLEIVAFSDLVPDVALLSDGLEPLALHYASKTVYNPFFKGMFRPLLMAEAYGEITTLSSSLAQFLSSERIRARTSDDISLVLATCRKKERSC